MPKRNQVEEAIVAVLERGSETAEFSNSQSRKTAAGHRSGSWT